jgi:membrane protease YdiL (CAAX protease family)
MVSYEPIRPGGSPFHVAVTWLVILVSVGLIGVDNFRSPYSAAASTATGSAAENRNIGVEIGSRYVVGAWALNRAHPERLPNLLSRLDGLANTPQDRLELAIIAGQVQGASAAIDRIDALKPQLEQDPDLRQDADALRDVYAGGVESLTAAQRQRLLDRYRWFGRVALAYGAPPHGPAEKAALAPAVRTLAAVGTGGLLLVAAFIAGFVLCALSIIWLALGKVRLAYRPPAGSSVPLLEAFAIYVASVAAVEMIFRAWAGPAGVGGIVLRAVVTVAIAVVPIIWPLLRGMPGREFRQAVGWHAGRGALREIGIGILGYIGGLPVLAIGFLITAALINLTGIQPNQHPIVRLIGQGPGRTAELFILASIYAPIAEETLFRGALFSRLRGRFGWLVSASIVSLIFAALHPQGWVAIPVLFSIAIVLAALREWRGSILPSMAAHSLNNTIMLLLLTVCLS